MKRLGISALGFAILIVGTGLAMAAPKNSAGSQTNVQSPPRESTVGMTQRSTVAKTKGANKKGFCPPGQQRKPGKGSAFNC